MTAKKVLLLCGDYMEEYEVLHAYGVSVDAACSGKKAGDACRTAVHQPTGGCRRKPAGSTRERAKISVGGKEIPRAGEREGRRMSWQTYVDEQLLCDIDGQRHAVAAILGHDAAVWVQSEPFPEVLP
ncbi:hypothetical protein ZWY2020_034285 [Hordeum vulgare]|nr:hypothetical protein ZWY2020_034285 [Hordeum vulgare]